MAGGEGFEPSTPNLGGWCSIQTEPQSPASATSQMPDEPTQLSVLSYSPKTAEAKEIPIDKLLKIEKVAIYLEGKGRQPNTIDSFRRHIAILARHADLDNMQEVELVIARLKLTDPSTKKPINKPASFLLSNFTMRVITIKS